MVPWRGMRRGTARATAAAAKCGILAAGRIDRPINRIDRPISNPGDLRMNVSVYAACGWAAICATCAQAQTASSLDEVVVTAKSLEEELPQQLALYGTRVDTISAAKIQNGGYLDVAGR